jgi:HEAT repeat protein
MASLLIRSLMRSRSFTAPSRIARSRTREASNLLRSLPQALQLIRSSPLLGWLAVAMVLFALLYNSLSFAFAEAVAARFSRTDSLATFIGLFNAVINGAALFVSLFAANRLFARFGVPTMVLTLGGIYFAGFATLSFGVGFAALISFRLIQMVWVNGVWITGWQALFTIVPPERRGQVTSFMDGAAWVAGMVLAGGTIIAAEMIRGDRAVFVVGVAASSLLMHVLWRARRTYGPAVAEAVRAGRPDVFTSEEEPFGGFRHDADAVSILVKSAADPDPDIRRVAISIAADVGSRETQPALLTGAADDDPDVRAAALRGLADNPHSSGTSLAADALDHPDDLVRACAVDALVACSNNPEWVEARLRPRLSDMDPTVRARAAAGLVRVRRDPDCRALLVAMLSSQDSEARAAAAAALGELGEEADLLVVAIDDEDPKVRRAAVRALSLQAPNGRHRALVPALADSDIAVRDAAATSITALGREAAGLLEDALSDAKVAPHAVRLLQRWGGAHFERVRDYAREQVAAATRYGRLARRVGSGDERVELLTDSLKAKMIEHATNALWADAAFGDGNRLGPAIEALTSSQSSERATALEAIESLGQPEIVRPLLDLWDEELDHHRDLDPVLAEMLDDDDAWLRACTVFVIESHGAESFRGRLHELSTTDPDRDVRITSQLALEGVERMKTLDTLPLMRRVLFLRKVMLFAGLSPADLKSVAIAAEENLFADGELIAAQGEPGGEMHVVVAGEIEVDLGSKDGEVELARRRSGEVVGEMSLITQEPRMASLIAVGEVRTLSIDRQRFERILVERPDVGLAVMRQLCTRLQQSADASV